MLIGSQFKLSQINSDFTVKVNNTPLERVIKHKSLGVQIDESLNWRPHIHTISKKISAGIAILRRVSHFIPFDTRVNMYNAMVMPYFNYWSAVWGNIFTNTSNVHSHNLRNSELNYYVPRPRTESAKGSLHYRGSVLWNTIPSEIRKPPSLNVFKTSFHGKDYLNTPWLIVTLIIKLIT